VELKQRVGATIAVWRSYGDRWWWVNLFTAAKIVIEACAANVRNAWSWMTTAGINSPRSRQYPTAIDDEYLQVGAGAAALIEINSVGATICTKSTPLSRIITFCDAGHCA
jgi:hypothetical protein